MMTGNKNKVGTKRRLDFEMIIKYPLLLLGLGGVFPDGSCIWLYNKGSVNHIPEALAKRLPFYGKSLYRLVLAVVNLMCLVKTIALFIVFESLINTTVEQSLIIPLSVAVWGAATWVFKKYYPPLLAAFKTYESRFGYTNDTLKTHRCAKVAAVCILSVHFCFKFSLGFAHVSWLDDTPQFIFPFSETDMFTRWFACMSTTFFYGIVELPVFSMLLLYTVIVHVLTMEFTSAREDMDQLLKTMRNFDERFTFIRERHRCLQDIVAIASRVFRSSVVFTFVFNILVFCFLIYWVSERKTSTYGLAVQTAAILGSVGGTICVTVSGGRLNMAAHSICESINTADWSNLPVPTLLKMNLFLTQFASKKIGFNIYGLFYLDTTTLLMITGTVITYGVVYLQFTLRQITCQCQTVTVNDTVID